MKRFLFRVVVLGCLVISNTACNSRTQTSETSRQEENYPLNLSDMHIRDPFILANVADSTYYMHANSGKKSFLCYASKDLRRWKLCGESFRPDPDFGVNTIFGPQKSTDIRGIIIFLPVSSPNVIGGESPFLSRIGRIADSDHWSMRRSHLKVGCAWMVRFMWTRMDNLG